MGNVSDLTGAVCMVKPGRTNEESKSRRSADTPDVNYWAHSRPDLPAEKWEPLADHLRRTAELAADFGKHFGCPQWCYLAGLWHDLGKYAKQWQKYLYQSTLTGKRRGQVEHSTAGAKHANTVLEDPQQAMLLSYILAGHHGGLPDWDDAESERGLVRRLKKQIPFFINAPKNISRPIDLPNPPLKFSDSPQQAAFQASFLCRMLFSCLVDADFLATEEFLSPQKAQARITSLPDMKELEKSLDSYVAQLSSSRESTSVNQRRAEILQSCKSAAEMSPGLFSLTVPTGGGKTFSSMAFALKHARVHGMDRIISVIPYTSIIEQNADCYRRAFASVGEDIVLEHHSNLQEDRETTWTRLASENWEAPIIVTTNVQFFESLFASRPSRCRKLHNIARSVIILDEVQMLPVERLEPCLEAIRELANNYHCTVVLCSATQPALDRQENFTIGLEDVREIIPDPPSLYEDMRRTKVQWLGRKTREDLAGELLDFDQVLCVVNTRRSAAELYHAIGPDNDAVHLSAAMCPEHRTSVLSDITSNLDKDHPCRVISTQLVEAGVDLDFPVVYRAVAGIDSIAQAAGRCNREGKLRQGRVFVFEQEKLNPHGPLRMSADKTRELLGMYKDDLLGLDAVRKYFELYYWTRKSEWDKKNIMQLFTIAKEPRFQFRKAAQSFQMIEDVYQPVIVPWGEKGKEVAAELTSDQPPDRRTARRVQRFIVTVPTWIWKKLKDADAVRTYHDKYPVLVNLAYYSETLGLQDEPTPLTDSGKFVC